MCILKTDQSQTLAGVPKNRDQPAFLYAVPISSYGSDRKLAELSSLMSNKRLYDSRVFRMWDQLCRLNLRWDPKKPCSGLPEVFRYSFRAVAHIQDPCDSASVTFRAVIDSSCIALSLSLSFCYILS